MARLRGELKELPSSCGGSLAVSLTVRRSARAVTQPTTHETESPKRCVAPWGAVAIHTTHTLPPKNRHLLTWVPSVGHTGEEQGALLDNLRH